MTHKYNAREKRKRRKAKIERAREKVKELIAKAAKNKPAKKEAPQETVEESQAQE